MNTVTTCDSRNATANVTMLSRSHPRISEDSDIIEATLNNG
jgi:hypothetical protein